MLVRKRAVAGSTNIEWATDIWNPVRGCSIVSAGCTNCYAMRYAHRFSSPGFPYEGLTKSTHGGPVWTGEVRTVPGVLDVPLRWKQPKRIFVNSMSDLFHEDVPPSFIERVWLTMRGAPRHTFQILTKRAARMRSILSSASFDSLAVLPNVWLGVSVEDQRSADERIPLLLQTPAAVRWISAEPLLGPVQLSRWMPCSMGDVDTCPNVPLTCCQCDDQRSSNDGLNWVVVGGESGPKARPFDPDWASAIILQCKSADVPVFVKQLGSRLRWEGAPVRLKARKGGDPSEWPEALRVREYP